MNAQAYADVFAADKKPMPPQMIRGGVQGLDVLLIILAALLSHWIAPTPADPRPYIFATTVAVILSLLILRLSGSYTDAAIFSKVPRVKPVVVGWIAVMGLLLFIDFGVSRTAPISRSWGFLWAGGTLLLLIAERTALSVVINHLAHTGHISQRSVIVGAGPIGRRFAASLNRMGEPQTKVIGFIDARAPDADEWGDVAPDEIESYPVIGKMEDLVWLVREERIEQVFVALPASGDGLLDEILESLSMLPVHVRLIPAIASMEFPNRPISTIAGMPIIHVSDKPISGWNRFVKAVEDKVIASLVLLFSLPFFLLIALAVKLDSPGPVFFRQARRGFNNRLFEVFKFRSMYHEKADPDCDVQTTHDDPRVTRVGRFLRRTSLDELPQLLNVLKGDMSIVGPRPHAVSTKAQGRLFEEVVREYPSRYRVKPGITGWAQVNGWRGETDTEEKLRKRIEYDLFYIENWSVMLDVWIMIKTVFVVFNDDKAY